MSKFALQWRNMDKKKKKRKNKHEFKAFEKDNIRSSN